MQLEVRKNSVIPTTTENIINNIDIGKFIVRNFDTGFIEVRIHAALNMKARVGSG